MCTCGQDYIFLASVTKVSLTWLFDRDIVGRIHTGSTRSARCGIVTRWMFSKVPKGVFSIGGSKRFHAGSFENGQILGRSRFSFRGEDAIEER